MILITPDDRSSDLNNKLRSLEQQLAQMRSELEEMSGRIKDGDFGELKNATTAIMEIRRWVRLALEAEAQLEERRRREQGIVHEFAIDFSEARHTIRGHLDRIRRAKDSG